MERERLGGDDWGSRLAWDGDSGVSVRVGGGGD